MSNSNSDKQLRKSSQRKKQAIQEAAKQLFMEVGYEAMSMSDIVDRVGGSKSTIYSYFDSKQSLFEAIIDDALQDHIKPLYDVNIDHMPLKDGLYYFAEKAVQTILSKDSIEVQRLVFAESNRQKSLGKAYWKHGPSLGYGGLKNYFDREKSLGNLKCNNTEKAAEYFWGMLLLKIMLQRLSNVMSVPSKKKIDETVSEVVEDFLLLAEQI